MSTLTPANGSGSHSEKPTTIKESNETDKPHDNVTPIGARRLFDMIDVDRQGLLDINQIEWALTEHGLTRDDPRLKTFFSHLERTREIDRNLFSKAVTEGGVLVERALTGQLIIPNFQPFCETIAGIYHDVKDIDSGKVADYIPQLKRVDAKKFGLSICTVDGQRFSIGDSTENFSIQSCSKPLNYLLSMEAFGTDKVHQHVGREPSGHSFNEITLDSRRRPHNPMINAGAIMTASLVHPKMNSAERFDEVLHTWKRICGGAQPYFNNAVYLSEKQTADRNFALAYFMRENGAFPEGTNLQEVLEFYFQCCSIELTTDSFSVAAATLARSGQCPLTGEVVFKPENVKHCLSLMHSCGMYDFSGEFAFSIGLPAKSGVGGGLMIVVPNVMGICIWSPPLDENGNTVRGIEFSKRLLEKFNFHNYDSLLSVDSTKADPRLMKNQKAFDTVMALCWACAQGDLHEVRRLLAMGVDIDEGDYDGRTPMHLAASEGHANVVRFLLVHGASVAPTDRWGGTPRQDAEREGHKDVLEVLDQFKNKN